MTLRIHWRLSLAHEVSSRARVLPPGVERVSVPDLEAQVRFCRLAEACGIDSVLMACGYYMPDPIPLSTALALGTEKLRFLIAYRPGLMAPPTFVQQINTLSTLVDGRVSLNMVAGHSTREQLFYGDSCEPAARARRMGEFLEICRALWRREGELDFDGEFYRIAGGTLGVPFLAPGRSAPEIYIGGRSTAMREVAARHADCWLSLGASPEDLREHVTSMVDRGIDVGLRFSLVIRPTRDEAIHAAYAMVHEDGSPWIRRVFGNVRDHQAPEPDALAALDEGWLTPYLWSGAVERFGMSAICLVGSPDDIVAAIGEYRAIGVTQFIFSGWPNHEVVQQFGREVLPRLRTPPP